MIKRESMEKREEKKAIRSRGIPSKFSLYLPPHYSKEIRAFEANEIATKNIWRVEEVINFVFPKKYQPTYHEISVKFIKAFESKGYFSAKETAEFIKREGISKATFYNRVLPRLKAVGMVKVEREPTLSGKSKKYKMKISLSRSFGNYMNKIGDSWLAFVDDVRSRAKEENEGVKREVESE